MNASTESQNGGAMDFVKWTLAILLLASAVVGNYLYAEMSVLVRAIGVVGAVIAALLVAAQTEKGKTALAFAKESKIEVRKVVWPTRQEAIQTTLIVLAATVIMSLLLWGLDSILMWLVGLITGLKV